jgi:hypothetical protein
MKNLIKKILKERMSINSDGELVDDGNEFTITDNEELRIDDEVSVMIWVGTEDFVFPGHYGTVSVIGTDEKNGNPKGVVIEEELQYGDESMLYKKGYLEWDDEKEMWDFYPYYGNQLEDTLNEHSVKRVISEDYNQKRWEFRISYNNAKDNIEEIFNDVMDTDEINNPEKAKDIIIDIIHQVYDEYNEQSIDDDEDNDDDTSMEIRGIGKYLDDDDESPKSVMGAIKYGLTPKVRRK